MLRLPDMQQQECSNLMEVVRELTDSRSRLVCAKTNLAEQLAELRHDYMRVARVADLSRTVSKENVAKAAKAQKSLRQVIKSCKGPGSAHGKCPCVSDGRGCGHHLRLRQPRRTAPGDSSNVCGEAEVGQGKTAVVVMRLAGSVPGDTVAHRGLTALTKFQWQTDTSSARECYCQDQKSLRQVEKGAQGQQPT